MKNCALKWLCLLAPAVASAASVQHQPRDLPPASSIEPGWSYSGCYDDSTSSRALNGASKVDFSGMTGAACVAFCKSRGFRVAGTEYSVECWCGTQLPASMTQDPSTCNMACSGDQAEACGGYFRLSVYEGPSYDCPADRPLYLCCRGGIVPWSSSSTFFAGCGYTPTDPSEPIGSRCIPSKLFQRSKWTPSTMNKEVT